MKITNKTVGIGIITIFLSLIVLSGIKYYFFDIYLLSLNGKVDGIRKNIQQAMFLSVEKKEYNIAHFWPQLQNNIEVGDRVYKKPKDYHILLFKKGGTDTLICNY